ncbi:MAG: phage tail tip lysozyme [Methylobacterium frigidaeris]
MSDRQTEAYEFFKSKGWSPVQAAAIVGHGLAESGLRPGQNQIGGNAYGGWQWDDRKPALFSWMDSKGYKRDDFRGQMEFVQHELETTESFAADRLRQATNIESATAAFMHFERPKGYTRNNPAGGHNWSGRLSYAKAVYGGSASYPSLGGGAVSEATVTAPPSSARVNWSDPIEPKSPVNDVEMNAFRSQQAQAVTPYGFGEGLWEATKDAQTMTWLAKGQTDLLPDPTWSPTKETLKLAQDGVPAQFHDQFGKATSQAHLEQIKASILEDVEREKRLDAMGWTGTGIRIGAAFTDVVGLGLTVLAPEIGLPAKASRLAAMGVRGAEGAAINAALEVPRVMEKPTAHGSDVLWAAGAGLALGGAFGALGRNPAVAEEAAELTRIGKAMQRHADAEDAAGKQLATPTLGGGMVNLGGSAGAARTSAREGLTEAAGDWAHAAVDEAIARSWKPGWRWDLAGKGKGSDNAATRAFMGNTVTDVVGNADKSKVAGRTAEEYQKQIEWDFGMMSDKAHREGFETYAKRLEVPRGDRDTARARFNSEVTEVIDNRLPGREFSPEAVATADKLRQGYKGLLELAQNPGLLDGSTRRAVKGFEEIPVDLNYRPNIANHERIDALTTRYGDDVMREFLRNAFQAANRELPENIAKSMAKGYLKSLREATAGMTGLDRAIQGTDLEGLKRALDDLDLDDDATGHILRMVTPSEEKGGTIARAKRRALYENTFEMQVKARDGSWETLRMKDLFLDDSHVLFNSYARQMSGQIAMSMVQVKNPLHVPAEVTRTTRKVAEKLTPEERVLSALHDLGPDGAPLSKLHGALSDLSPEAVEKAISKLRKSGGVALKEPVQATTADRLMRFLQETQGSTRASVSLKELKEAFPDLSMGALEAELKGLDQRRLGTFSQLTDPKTVAREGHLSIDRGGEPAHLFALLPEGRKFKPVVADENSETAVQALKERPAQRFREEVTEDVTPALGPEFLIDGITGRSDFDKLVRDMRATWDARTDLPHDRRMKLADADQKRMEFVYDRVTGIPDQFDRTTLGRGLQVIRDYNFIRVMNQVGLAQIGETLGVVTRLGIKAAMQGVPTFRAMTRDAITGELNSAFARDIEQLSGFGADWFRDGFKGHTRDAAGGLINRSAQSDLYTSTQDLLHTGKRVTSVISGMAPIDTMAKRWASAAVVMKILNAAVKSEGATKVHGLNMDRMRALGPGRRDGPACVRADPTALLPRGSGRHRPEVRPRGLHPLGRSRGAGGLPRGRVAVVTPDDPGEPPGTKLCLSRQRARANDLPVSLVHAWGLYEPVPPGIASCGLHVVCNVGHDVHRGGDGLHSPAIPQLSGAE